QVDNVESADDASLSLLAALAKESARSPLLLMTTAAQGTARESAIGFRTLLERSQRCALAPLSAADVRELTRSLFGDAPRVHRFADWLFDRTAGSPLYALEMVRQLVEKHVIRYAEGMWTLPDHAPAAGVPAALGDILSARLERLSESARILAECLGL